MAGVGNMIPIAPEKANYIADFEPFEKNGASRAPGWVRELRQKAFARFAELNFPTFKDEEWKYTSVAPLLKVPFRLAAEHSAPTISKDELNRLTFGQPDWNRLVFVNGIYSKELSFTSRLPGGVIVRNLAQALVENPELVREHLGRYAGFEGNIFTALGAAFLQQGAFVCFSAGARQEEPIHLLFVSTGQKTASVAHLRNLIVAEEGSRASVIENYIGFGAETYFSNVTTEIFVGEKARLEHYKLQREGEAGFQINTTEVRQERESRYAAYSVDMGGKLVRNNHRAVLDEKVECHLDGLYLGGGQQHIDNHTAIDHQRPNSKSFELYKGILDGRARAVFNGKVFVRQPAQKTDSKQTNRNLILSDLATVDTKPQLEIFADDVKCTHGATVGQLDEESIFYLLSRGLSRPAAARLLTYGFANDIIGRIELAPVKAELEAELSARLLASGR
jgi:Fe-S cluster assembly protein SufD